MEEFGFGFPPRLFGKKFRETLYSVNLLPLGAFVKVFGEDGDPEFKRSGSEENIKRSFAAQPVFKKALIIAGGIAMNIVVGWVLLSSVFMIGIPQRVVIGDVALGSPAQAAELRTGDAISEIRHGTIILNESLTSDKIIQIFKDTPGAVVEMTIERGKETLTASLTGRKNPPYGEGPLGITLFDIGLARESNPFVAFWRGFVTTGETLSAIVLGFINLFSQIFTSSKILDTLTGPVGIVSLAVQASSLGIVYLLQLMALISLNLAILNFIPFPALDGGRLFFLLIEKVKGTPISARLQTMVNTFGFVILLALMALITFRDINKFF